MFVFLFQWLVAIGALEILYKILCEHKIQASHFVGDTQLAQGDGIFMASKPPGHTLMILMLNDSGLLRLVYALILFFIFILDSFDQVGKVNV